MICVMNLPLARKGTLFRTKQFPKSSEGLREWKTMSTQSPTSYIYFQSSYLVTLLKGSGRIKRPRCEKDTLD